MKTNIVTMDDFILVENDPVAKKAAKQARKATEAKIDNRNESILGKYKKSRAEIKQRIRKLKAQRKALKYIIKDEKRRLKAAKLTYKADSIRF